MKAISVKQPWATLIRLGMKRFETRNTRLLKVGDLVAIHASKSWTAQQRDTMDSAVFAGTLGRFGITAMGATHADMPRGTILGVALVKSALPTEEALPALQQIGIQGGLEQAFGDYTPGRWAFCLMPFWPVSDPYIHARGQLGAWTVPAGVEHRIKLALQWNDNLPDELTSPALVEEAIQTAQAREAKAAEVDALMARLKGGGRLPDTRSPIDRLIDQAVGR